jgi:hypothetical protein
MIFPTCLSTCEGVKLISSINMKELKPSFFSLDLVVISFADLTTPLNAGSIRELSRWDLGPCIVEMQGVTLACKRNIAFA